MRLAVEEGFGSEAVCVAKALLQESDQDYQKEFTKIMTFLKAAGQPELVLELFYAFKHQVDNRIPFNVALGACQSSKKWQEAIDLLVSICQFQPQAQDISMALDTVARSGRWQQTLELYDQLLSYGMPTSISTYTICFRACLETEDHFRAAAYVQQMDQDNISENSFIQRTLSSLNEKRFKRHALSGSSGNRSDRS
jgi:hypothetical protein